MALKLQIAQNILLDAIAVMPTEQVQLSECHQRVLAQTVTAAEDFPPFDRSPLDGYALIADQVQGASKDLPVILRVVDNIPAGRTPEVSVAVGMASRIMTGAPLPSGATGVVRMEDTRTDNGQVTVMAGANAAANICRRGEEITAGKTVIDAGGVVNAGTLGLLALLGVDRPLVYKRPKVALIATGSEIVPVEATLGSAVIRDSNSYMLSAQVADAGAEPLLWGIVRDSVSEIVARLKQAENADMVISTGGVSVGDYDLLAEAYRQLGVTVLFHRIGIKPGMPVLAGLKDGRLYIGLSGNPAAAGMAFEQLVRPALLKMAGRRNWWRPSVRAKMTVSFGKISDVVRFVWANCFQQGAGLVAEPLGLQGNGMLRSSMQANSLIVVPENSLLIAGSEVEVILLREFGKQE